MILAHMRSSLSIFVFGLHPEVLGPSKNTIARYLDLLEKDLHRQKICAFCAISEVKLARVRNTIFEISE